MARSLNKVELIGNLTRDPELRYTPQGTAVCSFGLATNRQWTTDSGEKKEDVELHWIREEHAQPHLLMILTYLMRMLRRQPPIISKILRQLPNRQLLINHKNL